MRPAARLKSMLAWLGVTLAVASTALGGDFEFVVIGDTRPTFESMNFRRFENLIPMMNSLHPALIINVGDLIFGYGPRKKEEQWDKYQKVIEAIEPPYYQVPGNHDTHSREARKIYGRRFGKFYQSFDYEDCHFVLLDNTEQGRWGYIGPAQLEWLKADLKRTQARQVFVFLHFPVWEPERVTPRYYEFWEQTLHPLFRASRVSAVFGGHFHSYGPTRQYDGIRYFITGGGGAELRPEYKSSGGEFHFMKVSVTSGDFDVRVVTERGEMTDTQADVMGGLMFAERNTSRIGIRRGLQDLKEGLEFPVSLKNPYSEYLRGEARWVYDSSAFSVEPEGATLQIAPGSTQRETFTIRALTNIVALQSLPRLQFDVRAGREHRRFHRELRFVEQAQSPFRRSAPALDGRLEDWGRATPLTLKGSAAPDAEIRSSHDSAYLYLAITIPVVTAREPDEVSEDLQIGMARRLGETDFGPDFLRLGFNGETTDARNRTPGRKRDTVVPGVRSFCRTQGDRRTFEIAIPFRLLKYVKSERSVVLDLCFPLPDDNPAELESTAPAVNSFAYRVLYGADSLMPVHFVELELEPRTERR